MLAGWRIAVRREGLRMDDRGSSGVPEGWEQSVLSQGIELISGQHIEASRCNDYGLGSPYLTGPADFPNDKIIVTKYTEDPKVTCEKGDILLTVKGSGTGKSIIANNEYCISRQLMAVRPKDYDAGFVFYILKSNEENYGSKSTGLIPGITRDDVLKTSVCLPPLEEQRKIADILSTWDDAIEQQTRLIELKRERKRSLMQQLLTGKVRFKEFEGLEWGVKCLEEVADVDKRSLSNTTDPKFSFRYISLSDVENGRVAGTTKTLRFGEAPSRARKILRDSDVLMATVRPNLKGFAIIRSEAHNYIASTGFAVITAKANTSAEYIYQSLFSRAVEQQVSALVAGSNYPAISTSDVKSLEISCPPFPEQQKIATVLSAADTELETLQTQLTALRTQKRGLMQQLLTGKTRVKLDDPVTAQ